MIGEENEKKDIDEETALDHDPRLTELGRLMTCVIFDCRIHFAVCLNLTSQSMLYVENCEAY